MGPFADKYTLGDTSPLSPALASVGGRLYLAWRGDGNNNLNVMSSADFGRTWGPKYTSPETSDQAPALTAHNGGLCIAWKGHGNDHLNVAHVNLAGPSVTGFANKVTLGDTSPLAPALASLGGVLYLAWRGDGNKNLNVMASSDNGHTFSHKYTSPESSDQAPALTAHNGGLCIAWKGHGNDHLNVAHVNLAGPSVTGFANKVTLGDTSPLAPALASLGGVLYLAWRGDGNKNLNVMASSDNGHTFGGKYTSPETSDAAPVLGTYGRVLFIGWRGHGNDHLNLAQAASNLETGTARPLYYILSVLYAPPGTNGGHSTSSVDYSTGSTTGTTTSTSSSFKAGIAVAVDTSFNVGVVQLGASAGFTASRTTTNSSSLDIKKSVTYDIKCSGPDKDGINHDLDLFYLWLNPRVNISIDPENNIAWGVGVDGPTMIIQYVYAAWLKNPATMPAGVKRELDAAGLKPTDYATILAANPFAHGATAIDPNRFLPVSQSFPYEPPFTASDPVPTQTLVQQNTVTSTSTHTVQNQYGVSVTASAGIKTPFTASLKVTGTFDWTNTSSSGTSSANTQSANVTIGGPAFGYTGPTDILVYWDTVYNSFLFAFPQQQPIAMGTLSDHLGHPLPHALVTLKTTGHPLTTFTDAKGKYRFYGTTSGHGTVTVSGRDFPVTLGHGVTAADLHLT